MRRFCFLFLITILFPLASNADIPPCRIVNAPTAGILPHRSYYLETHLFDGGGVTQRVIVGLFNYVNLGVSYSGSGVIGSDKVNWQPQVGFQASVRIVEESMRNPAVSIGFDSQGQGPYIRQDGMNRFLNKSRGFYAAVSRNYSLLGNLGLHGGANYSLEDSDGDHDPSFWAGFDKDLGQNFEFACEYDFATNDNENGSITSGKGYLNTGFKIKLNGSFILEFNLENILRNTKEDYLGVERDKPQPSRELRLTYIGSF